VGAPQSTVFGFPSTGIGTTLSSGEAGDEFRVQKIYFGYLCTHAEIPHAGSVDGQDPDCLYDEFSVSDWNTLHHRYAGT
jgi:hypothetical protein